MRFGGLDVETLHICVIYHRPTLQHIQPERHDLVLSRPRGAFNRRVISNAIHNWGLAEAPNGISRTEVISAKPIFAQALLSGSCSGTEDSC